MELTPPLPLDCTPPDDCCSPLLDEPLFDELLEELPVELFDELLVDPLDPVDDFEVDDDLDVDDELCVVAA